MVKFADTQKDKEQRRLQQQLAQQMQQLNTATWGNLTGLGGLTPQYLAVSVGARAAGRWMETDGQTDRHLLHDPPTHPPPKVGKKELSGWAWMPPTSPGRLH